MERFPGDHSGIVCSFLVLQIGQLIDLGQCFCIISFSNAVIKHWDHGRKSLFGLIVP